MGSEYGLCRFAASDTGRITIAHHSGFSTQDLPLIVTMNSFSRPFRSRK